MPVHARTSLPLSITFVIALLMLKTVLPIIGEIVPRFMVAGPLPSGFGAIAFLIPAVILPVIIAIALVRSPAAGFWATLAYGLLTACLSGLLLLTPYITTTWTVNLQGSESAMAAQAFQQAWRLTSLGFSLLLVLSILRPSVMRWVNGREEELRMTRFPSRRTTTIATRAVWILPLVVGATLPTLVWLWVAHTEGHFALGDAVMEILSEHLSGRAMMLDLFSMLPYVILSVTAYRNARRMSAVTLWSVTIGGLVGIMALMVPMYYFGSQTLYNDVAGDERTTGAMIFFFTPLYCIAAMLGGMLLGWITARMLRRGVDDLIEDHT